MLNSIKYSMIRAMRDKEFILSSLLVSIAMGTIMYFATGTMMDEINDGSFEIKIAVVTDGAVGESQFVQVLKEIDFIAPTFTNMEGALDLLEHNEITGIFEITDAPRLLVRASGPRAQILQSIADEYITHAQIFEQIARENPTYLEATVSRLMSQTAVLTPMENTADLTSMMQLLMIAFVSMAAISGVFVGFERAILTNNDASKGSRRLVSAAGKMKMLAGDLIGGALVALGLSAIIWAYFALVLNVELHVNLFFTALAAFLVCLFGVSFGAFFGLVAPGKRKTREQILQMFYMAFIMLAMFGAQVRVPVITTINRFNPASLMMDALTALNIGNFGQYLAFMMTLLTVSIVCLILTFVSLRRNRDVDTQ